MTGVTRKVGSVMIDYWGISTCGDRNSRGSTKIVTVVKVVEITSIARKVINVIVTGELL